LVFDWFSASAQGLGFPLQAQASSQSNGLVERFFQGVRRHFGAQRGLAAAEAEAVASAFETADVAGETLALAYEVRASGVVYADFGILPGESEFDTTVPKGTYANTADFTVAVTRIGGAQ